MGRKVVAVFVIMVPEHWFLLPEENLVALTIACKRKCESPGTRPLRSTPCWYLICPAFPPWLCQSVCNHIIVNVGAVNCMERKMGYAWWVMGNFLKVCLPSGVLEALIMVDWRRECEREEDGEEGSRRRATLNRSVSSLTAESRMISTNNVKRKLRS